MLTAFDSGLFEEYVNRIMVYSRTEIGFEMKCGITLKERLALFPFTEESAGCLKIHIILEMNIIRQS